MNEPLYHQELHLVIDATGTTAVEQLHAATGLSKQCIKSAMSKGCVWLSNTAGTRRLRRAKRTLQAGDEVHLYYDAGILAETPPRPTLIADLSEYSIWRKPCGLRSQGSKWGDHCTITRWAEQHLLPERPAFTVHRLDRAANGLIIVAHSKSMAATFAALFRERQIEKHYLALVAGDLSRRHDIGRIEDPIDGKSAISDIRFQALSSDKAHSLVDVRIETGRKHQIRRHLAGQGYAIMGDRLYGSGITDGLDLQLTAYRLAFICPVTQQAVEYSLPDKHLPALS